MKRNLLLLLLMVGTVLLVPACASIATASPDDSGEIEIVLSDYKFEPEVIRLKVGQTVHIKLRNEGDKMHEFMVGRDVQIHGNFTEGFGQDFFAGITPQINGPGMVMGGPEAMDMEGMDMDGEAMDMEEDGHEDDGHAEEEMQMGEGDDHVEDEMTMPDDDDHAEDDMTGTESDMDMEDDGHAEDDMAMGEEEMEMSGDDDHTADDMTMGEEEHTEDSMEMGNEDHEEGEEDDHEEEGVAGEFGPLQMPLMDAHAGLMVMIDPQVVPAGEVTTITFTVSEYKVGRWEMGCFQERGQHYDDGMNGIIIVEP